MDFSNPGDILLAVCQGVGLRRGQPGGFFVWLGICVSDWLAARDTYSAVGRPVDYVNPNCPRFVWFAFNPNFQELLPNEYDGDCPISLPGCLCCPLRCPQHLQHCLDHHLRVIILNVMPGFGDEDVLRSGSLSNQIVVKS